jgi:hypothetical protein
VLRIFITCAFLAPHPFSLSHTHTPQREYRIHPVKWTAPQLESWLRARGPQFADKTPKDLTGKVVMRWGPSQFSAFFGPKGGDLQAALRDEAARCDAEKKRQSF